MSHNSQMHIALTLRVAPLTNSTKESNSIIEHV